jgi:hypothetical protein
MRVAKRRTLETRPAIKTGAIIVFQTPASNWRERVRALKAAQDAARDGGDAASKPQAGA